MEGIFDAVKNAALIHKSGGGTSFSFSRLRPANDLVSSTSGVSSGPISFMKVFNVATETIKQGGTRRGANMGILRVDHPDILDFITCKEKNDELTNFNISIAITDVFMEALERDGEYNLINPRSKEVVHSLKASKVFHMIVERAWRNGEPGIVFIDTHQSLSSPLRRLATLNPLIPAVNSHFSPMNRATLARSIWRVCRNQRRQNRVDFNRLREIVHLAVRFLDNVIDQNRYPIPEIDKTTNPTAKIGLGVMGWADMLIKMNLAYDSEKALELAILSWALSNANLVASQELAKRTRPVPQL